MKSYLVYYHESRTHLSLGKDTPNRRTVQPPELGRAVAVPQVGGLHHRYERRAAWTRRWFERRFPGRRVWSNTSLELATPPRLTLDSLSALRILECLESLVECRLWAAALLANRLMLPAIRTLAEISD